MRLDPAPPRSELRGHVPAQSGKNELQAQLETYLLALFCDTPAEMVKVSPTLKPQAQTAMRRLERTLKKNSLYGACLA